jgi:hypothetical protein
MKGTTLLPGIILLTVWACEPKTSGSRTRNDAPLDQLGSTKSDSTFRSRILITYYDKHIPASRSYLNYGPFSTDVIYEATGASLMDYDRMLALAERTGYCCCPDRCYTVSLYSGTEEYETLFVDTVTSRDQVQIFESDYQHSYLVNRKDWLSFLSKTRRISFNEYFITDLEAARRVFNYTREHDLPVITSNRVSKEWMHFDGSFTIKIADIGGEINEHEVYNKIMRTYPKDSYKVETISEYRMCGSYSGDDCYNELILRIFCDKDFYDKFNLYGPRSYYEEALAEFYVLGARERLNALDALATKEDQDSR